MLWQTCFVLGVVLTVFSSPTSSSQTLDHREVDDNLQPPNGTAVGVSTSRTLTRRKRYILYPRGSSIQLVYCTSVRGYIPFQTLFVFGMTAGLAWQLPNESQQLYLQKRSLGRDPDREHRANLYASVTAFLSQRGFHGEECVKRTLCERSDPSLPRGTLMEELLRVLFSLPDSGGGVKTTWDDARYNGTKCETRFPRCTSVLDLSLPIQNNQ